MVRPTDQQMAVIEKIVTVPKRKRSPSPCRVTWETSDISQEVRGVGRQWTRAFTMVSMGRNGQGRVSKFRIG